MTFAKTTQVPEEHAEPIDRGDRLQVTTALQAAQDWRSSSSRLLVLSGPVGTGKSLAAAWAVHDWCRCNAKRNPWGQLVYPNGQLWIGSSRLAKMLSSTLKACVEAVASLEKQGILVVDELGEEVDAAQSAAAIASLITTRFAHNRHTIITTNCGGPTFRERYGERLVDRLRGCGLREDGTARWWVTCAGESLRGRITPQPRESTSHA